MNQNGQWVLGPSLPENRFHVGIALITDSHVLIAGGRIWPDWHSTTQVHKFNIIHGTWTPIGNLDFPTYYLACERYILVNSTTIIICVGGYQKTANGSRSSDQAAAYNIDAESWTMVPEWNLPLGCNYANLQVVHGRLFIFGGGFEDGNMTRVLEFDEYQIPAWKEVANLPFPGGLVIPMAIPFWFPHVD